MHVAHTQILECVLVLIKQEVYWARSWRLAFNNTAPWRPFLLAYLPCENHGWNFEFVLAFDIFIGGKIKRLGNEVTKILNINYVLFLVHHVNREVALYNPVKSYHLKLIIEYFKYVTKLDLKVGAVDYNCLSRWPIWWQWRVVPPEGAESACQHTVLIRQTVDYTVKLVLWKVCLI